MTDFGLDVLRAVIAGAGFKDEDVPKHPLLDLIKKRQPYRPTTAEEFIDFLEGIPEPLQVGDLVRQRKNFILDEWPEGIGTTVVSQILTNPTRSGKERSLDRATIEDVALMFTENTDEEIEAAFAKDEGREPRKARLVEFLFDSRRLEKIGSIYD